MEKVPEVSIYLANNIKYPTVFRREYLTSFYFQYICLSCRPRQLKIKGYGPFRAHLRAYHHIDRLSLEDSNRQRSDGGYYCSATHRHYFVGDPGYNANKATSVGNENTQNSTVSAGGVSSGVHLTASEFTGLLASVTNTVQRNVSSGIRTTLQTAAILSDAMNVNENRRCQAIPNTNNFMVSIANSPDSSSSSSKYCHNP